MYEPVEHVLTLTDFTKNYETKLPQEIEVRGSLYGACFGSLKDNQNLNVYFKKESPVVTMKMSGYSYTVPINSTFKFSYLHNPSENLDRARKGYFFETVADLMKSVHLPSVVYVGKDCKSADKKTIIKQGQLLIIKGVESSGRKSKLLKCATNTDDIYLKESCEGQFSTKESLLLFPLSVLLKMKFQWPITTSVYDHTGNHLHDKFQTKSATLYRHQMTLNSLIVSSNTLSLDCPNLTEIYVKFQVEIRIRDTDMMQLRKTTNALSKVIRPKHISTVLYDFLPNENMLEKDLLLPANNTQWLQEVLLPSDSVYETVNIKVNEVIPRSLISEYSTSKDTLTPPVVCPMTELSDVLEEVPPPRPPSLPRSKTVSDYNVFVSLKAFDKPSPRLPPPLPFSPSPLSSTPSPHSYRTQSTIIDSFTISDITTTTSDHSYELSAALENQEPPIIETKESHHPPLMPKPKLTKKPRRSLSLISEPAPVMPKSLEISNASSKPCTKMKSIAQGEFFDENKRLLVDYNTEKVVLLLEQMGLKQYTAKFGEESINGRFLLELDDEVLQEELGMTKRLHRLKLLMIIRGTQCITDYIIE